MFDMKDKLVKRAESGLKELEEREELDEGQRERVKEARELLEEDKFVDAVSVLESVKDELDE